MQTKAWQGILFLPSIPFFFLHKRYRKPSFGIFHKNFLQKSFKKFQVHTAVNTSSRWKRFYTKTMICVFNKGVKGRGGGPWSSIFKEGEGVKGIPPYISVYYY